VAAIDGGATRWAAVSGEKRKEGDGAAPVRFMAHYREGEEARGGEKAGLRRRGATGKEGRLAGGRGDPDGWVPPIGERVRERGRQAGWM
jgi:hypothetical protein